MHPKPSAETCSPLFPSVRVMFMCVRPRTLVPQLANKIRRIVDAAGALVFRNLRIRTQRPRSLDLPVTGAGCDDAVRRLALLDPLVQRAHFVEDIRSFSARAMPHR